MIDELSKLQQNAISRKLVTSFTKQVSQIFDEENMPVYDENKAIEGQINKLQDQDQRQILFQLSNELQNIVNEYTKMKENETEIEECEETQEPVVVQKQEQQQPVTQQQSSDISQKDLQIEKIQQQNIQIQVPQQIKQNNNEQQQTHSQEIQQQKSLNNTIALSQQINDNEPEVIVEPQIINQQPKQQQIQYSSMHSYNDIDYLYKKTQAIIDQQKQSEFQRYQNEQMNLSQQYAAIEQLGEKLKKQIELLQKKEDQIDKRGEKLNVNIQQAEQYYNEQSKVLEDKLDKLQQIFSVEKAQYQQKVQYQMDLIQSKLDDLGDQIQRKQIQISQAKSQNVVRLTRLQQQLDDNTLRLETLFQCLSKYYACN